MKAYEFKKGDSLTAERLSSAARVLNALPFDVSMPSLDPTAPAEGSIPVIEAQIVTSSVDPAPVFDGTSSDAPHLKVKVYGSGIAAGNGEFSPEGDPGSWIYAGNYPARDLQQANAIGTAYRKAFASPQCVSRVAEPEAGGGLDRTQQGLEWRVLLSEVYRPGQTVRLFAVGDNLYFDIPDRIIIPGKITAESGGGEYTLEAYKLASDGSLTLVGNITAWALGSETGIDTDTWVWIHLDPYRNYFANSGGGGSVLIEQIGINPFGPDPLGTLIVDDTTGIKLDTPVGDEYTLLGNLETRQDNTQVTLPTAILDFQYPLTCTAGGDTNEAEIGMDCDTCTGRGTSSCPPLAVGHAATGFAAGGWGNLDNGGYTFACSSTGLCGEALGGTYWIAYKVDAATNSIAFFILVGPTAGCWCGDTGTSTPPATSTYWQNIDPSGGAPCGGNTYRLGGSLWTWGA